MHKLATALIDLGYQQPELRPHLRPILAHLESTASDETGRVLFEELQYAVKGFDVDKILELDAELQMKDPSLFRSEVRPYLMDASLPLIKTAKAGDQLLLVRDGYPQPTFVKVVSDMNAVSQSSLYHQSTLITVKAARGGKRIGEISIDHRRNTLYYRPHVNDVPSRVVIVM